MIWCNGNKDVRRDKWFAVTAPDISKVKAAVAWCKAQPSAARFYNHYTNTRWWFENEQDAAWFVLNWGSQHV